MIKDQSISEVISLMLIFHPFSSSLSWWCLFTCSPSVCIPSFYFCFTVCSRYRPKITVWCSHAACWFQVKGEELACLSLDDFYHFFVDIAVFEIAMYCRSQEFSSPSGDLSLQIKLFLCNLSSHVQQEQHKQTSKFCPSWFPDIVVIGPLEYFVFAGALILIITWLQQGGRMDGRTEVVFLCGLKQDFLQSVQQCSVPLLASNLTWGHSDLPMLSYLWSTEVLVSKAADLLGHAQEET